MTAKLTYKGIAFMALFVLLAMVPLWAANYWLYLAGKLFIYAIAALGLNIFLGHAGQANFGVSGLVLVGAYAAASLQMLWGLHLFAVIVPVLVVCGLFSYLLGKALLRLSHFSLAVGTFAFAYVLYVLVSSALPTNIFGGTDGRPVPPSTIGGQLLGIVFNYYFMLFWLLTVALICRSLIASRVGRAWHAIRDDETVASAAGINVANYKTIAFVFNGVIAGLAGVLIIQHTSFISPANYDIWSNLLYLLMLSLGGMGRDWGVMLGALVMMVIAEATARVVAYPTLFYGLTLFLVLRFMPDGIFLGASRAQQRIFAVLGRSNGTP